MVWLIQIRSGALSARTLTPAKGIFLEMFMKILKGIGSLIGQSLYHASLVTMSVVMTLLMLTVLSVMIWVTLEAAFSTPWSCQSWSTIPVMDTLSKTLGMSLVIPR